VNSPILFVCATAALILACAAPQKGGKVETTGQTPTSGMVVVSTAFKEGELIPVKYSGYGENVSPELAWENVPEVVKSFALICRDPDAPGGTFYHWVLFNVPDTVKRLPEGVGREPALSFGGTQGTNSFRRVGYDGPRPPMGTHRYYFDLYALDGMLVLDQTATAGQLHDAMKGHVLGQGSLMGRFKR